MFLELFSPAPHQVLKQARLFKVSVTTFSEQAEVSPHYIVYLQLSLKKQNTLLFGVICKENRINCPKWKNMEALGVLIICDK